MFIKKDLRKLEEIFNDEKDERQVLRLSKRGTEFLGNLRFLCRESRLSCLSNLRILNLYDNSLTSVQGIGILSQTPIEEINLGMNKLSGLPIEFGRLSTLKTLWLDDNEFEKFPTSLCQLKELKVLRLSGNCLKSVPLLISSMESLETLALEGNEVEEFPEGILQLFNLKHLWLRQNRLRLLPPNIDTLHGLVTLSVSSNQLESLPESMTAMEGLKHLYANGNHIRAVPETLCMVASLKEVNLANNALETIPVLWRQTWGPFGDSLVSTRKDIKITLTGNTLTAVEPEEGSEEHSTINEETGAGS